MSVRRSPVASAVVATAAALALSSASDAGAAVTLGSTSATANSCGTGFTEVQSQSTGNAYTAPSGGVITSWSHHARAGAGQLLKLKVFRPLTFPDFLVVGQSAQQALQPSQLNTFAVRIPVQAGDLLGQAIPAASAPVDCLFSGAGTDVVGDIPSDGANGTTATATVFGTGVKMNISAVLEPDADGDGFGDETQDACPTDASTEGACPPPPDTTAPRTSIDSQPRRRTRARRAVFRFSSNEPRASFQCKVDGGSFTNCSSPLRTNRLRRGRHTFAVRARDAAGNVDRTPATHSWKVKRRRAGR